MPLLVPLRPGSPLGDQIYVRLREAILEGRLEPGRRLPATRSLARELGVARNTVVAAYARLAAEGYVEGRRAAGTRVSRKLPAGGVVAPERPAARRAASARLPRPSSAFRRAVRSRGAYPASARRSVPLRWDFQYNVSVSDAASRRAWHRILRRCMAEHGNDPAPYDLTRRPGPLERAVARHLALARGVHCEPEQVILLNGAQQGFQLAARMLADPGDTVAIEDPASLGARNAFLGAGLRVVPVAGDADGLLPERLPRTPRVRFVHVAPSHQWPTGAVLPLDRRLRLLEWAAEHDAWIVEHDHNSEYTSARTPVMSLQGLDEHGRVLYVGTFSRLFSPEPEVAYAVVPRELAEGFVAVRELEAYWISTLEHDALARFLDAGELDSLVRRLTRRLRPLRDCLRDAVAALPGRPLVADPTGSGLHVHVVAPRVPAAAAEELVARCEAAGVGVFPDTPYWLTTPPAAGLLLGFARMTPEDIRAGVARLGEVVSATSGC